LFFLERRFYGKDNANATTEHKLQDGPKDTKLTKENIDNGDNIDYVDNIDTKVETLLQYNQ
jgi:hypothetical protein